MVSQNITNSWELDSLSNCKLGVCAQKCGTEFDPFGDFFIIFGASKLNLKMIEVPIHYRARTYGETQISRFSHGLLLIKMVVFAFLKLKAI